MNNLNQQVQTLQTDEQKQALASLREKDAARLATLRRNRIAEGFAFNLILHSDCCDNPRYLSERAAEFADALIAELDK